MPNRATSKSQYRFFRAVQGGDAQADGLSPEKAGEMIGSQSPKGLPEKKSSVKKTKKAKKKGKPLSYPAKKK